MRKVSALLLVFVLAFSMLAACSSSDKQANNNGEGNGNGGQGTSAPANGNNGPGEQNGEPAADVYEENGLPKGEEVTLKLGLWENGSGRLWLDKAVERFTERYPNVKFDVTATPTLETILEPKIAVDDDKDMFDLFFPRFSAVGQLERVAQAGKLEPMDDLWQREIAGSGGKVLRELISDDAYEKSTSTGMTAMLPIGGFTSGLFFDKQLFEKHNWNSSPATWDEFTALLEAIKAEGIIPITFPGIYASYLSDYVVNTMQFTLAEAKGVGEAYIKNFRSYTAPILLTEENKEAWARVYEWGKEGVFPAGVAALNHTQSQMQVLQHKAAMVATGDWVGNEMKQSTPEGFEWGFMAVPMTNDSDQTIYVNSGVTDVGFVIWKNKPDLHKQWAKEFIMSLFDFEVQEVLAADAGVYPIRLDFGDDPERIAKLQPAPAAVMEYAARHKVKYISYLRAFPLSSPEHGQASKLLSEMITSVATGKTDPLPVLENAEKLMATAVEKDRP